MIYYNYFPLTSKYISKERLCKPLLNSYIFRLINEKSNSFKLFKAGLLSYEENHRVKNRVNSAIKKAKRQYYTRMFEKYRTGLRKSWRLIHDSVGFGPKIFSNIETLSIIHNGETFSDRAQIAEIFSKFFGNIAVNLENELPQTSVDPLTLE